jgi:hypothetical protein
MKDNSTTITKKQIVIAAVILVIVIALTVFVLHFLFPKTKTTVVSQNIRISHTITPAPNNLISQYATKYTDIAESDGYSVASNPSNIPSIGYKGINEPYSIHLYSPNTISFIATPQTVTNGSSLFKETSAFLIKNGLFQESLRQDDTTIFDNTQEVCQVYNIPADTYNSASYGVSCLYQTDINSEYTTINNLLILSSTKVSTVSDITRTLLTQGNMSLNELYTVTPSSNPSSATLYFVSLGKGFSYIGSQATISIDTKAIPPASSLLKAALSNPVYGSFLTSHITIGS